MGGGGVRIVPGLARSRLSVCSSALLEPFAALASSSTIGWRRGSSGGNSDSIRSIIRLAMLIVRYEGVNDFDIRDATCQIKPMC